jgi:hypothetical protein
MRFNIWLAVSDAAQDIVKEYLRTRRTDEEYTGPLTRRQQRLFEYMQDETVRQSLFKSPTLQGTTYHLWSIDFDDRKEMLQGIRDEIENLMDEYPNQISVLGAWHFETGEQVGTRSGGDPLYPIPNFLWRFMPEEAGATSNADLVDVNLLLGQPPRVFV